MQIFPLQNFNRVPNSGYNKDLQPTEFILEVFWETRKIKQNQNNTKLYHLVAKLQKILTGQVLDKVA